ncbi:pirin family protein [Chamaesiphon sp. VAR_48_metabat_135_sub]|uniref:pirin family protein n=1 Tax=Chamaesiphon sp. VAR_48_metabat_135_sub TaxID=2964699 RepID=UPI00286BD86C|nr:pirin family protein [Chamaesiphon sp. VAR_48_metabat_135_sub]
MNQTLMPIVRKSSDRGHVQIDWLNSYHTFSFGSYQDRDWMGFRSLRVINDDIIAPASGFGTHGHRDMEIVTYVLSGALQHQDSLGTGAVIYPGEVQRMTAGTGITHSEFNHSPSESVHLLQIWIIPDTENLTPSYEQKAFTPEEKQGKLCLVASRDGRDGSVTIHQDANMYVGVIAANDSISYQVQPDRSVWLHVARGEVTLDDRILAAGDAVIYPGGSKLELSSSSSGEILLFDLG